MAWPAWWCDPLSVLVSVSLPPSIAPHTPATSTCHRYPRKEKGPIGFKGSIKKKLLFHTRLRSQNSSVIAQPSQVRLQLLRYHRLCGQDSDPSWTLCSGPVCNVAGKYLRNLSEFCQSISAQTNWPIMKSWRAEISRIVAKHAITSIFIFA